MRIGINATCGENRSGTGRYASELVAALTALDEENSYRVVVRRGSPLIERLAGRGHVTVEALVGDGLAARLWFERFGLGRWIAERELDVFHGPAFVIPPHCRAASVVTVHDLVFVRYPETVPWRRRGYYRRAIPRSIRQAGRVIADSVSTARDIRAHFAVAEDRIVPVHLGVEERFFAEAGAEEMARVRVRYGLPDRFILAVGTLEPRKNLSGLLRGYAALRRARPDAPELVLTGRQGWGVRGLRGLAGALGIAESVRWTGFVEDGDLPVVYRLADVFVGVPLYEGFGLPFLEALAAGVPVVAAANSSIPEVVGDVAFMTDAGDALAIGGALADALAARESGASAQRCECGRARARGFSWGATAARTLAVYESAVRG